MSDFSRGLYFFFIDDKAGIEWLVYLAIFWELEKSNSSVVIPID